MSRQTLITLLLLVPLAMALAGLWLHRRRGGARGNVGGTRLQHSEALRRVNILALLALVLACLAGLALLTR